MNRPVKHPFKLVGVRTSTQTDEVLGECDFIEIGRRGEVSFWLKNPDGESISEQWASAEGQTGLRPNLKVIVSFYDTSWLGGQLDRGILHFDRVDVVPV